MRFVLSISFAVLLTLWPCLAADANKGISLAELNPQPDIIYASPKATLQIPASIVRRHIPQKWPGIPVLGYVDIEIKEKTETSLSFSLLGPEEDLTGLLNSTLGRFEPDERATTDLSQGRHDIVIAPKVGIFTRDDGHSLTYWVDGGTVLAFASCKPVKTCHLVFNSKGFHIARKFTLKDLHNWKKSIGEVDDYLTQLEVKWTPDQTEAALARQEDFVTHFETADGDTIHSFQIDGKLKKLMLSGHYDEWSLEWREQLIRLTLNFDTDFDGYVKNTGQLFKSLCVSVDAKSETDPDPITWWISNDVISTWDPSLLAELKRAEFEVATGTPNSLVQISIPKTGPFHEAFRNYDQIYFVEIDPSARAVRKTVRSPKSFFICDPPGKHANCKHIFSYKGMAVSYQFPQSELGNWREWDSRAEEFIGRNLPSKIMNY